MLLALRHRWSDGTTHLRFHPLELLERLASLTPRPRVNLILYYGVLAAHAGWRPRLSSATAGDPSPLLITVPSDTSAATPATQATRGGSNYLWARLMQRSFPPSLGIDSTPSFVVTSPERIRVRAAH